MDEIFLQPNALINFLIDKGLYRFIETPYILYTLILSRVIHLIKPSTLIGQETFEILVKEASNNKNILNRMNPVMLRALFNCVSFNERFELLRNNSLIRTNHLNFDSNIKSSIVNSILNQAQLSTYNMDLSNKLYINWSRLIEPYASIECVNGMPSYFLERVIFEGALDNIYSYLDSQDKVYSFTKVFFSKWNISYEKSLYILEESTLSDSNKLKIINEMYSRQVISVSDEIKRIEEKIVYSLLNIDSKESKEYLESIKNISPELINSSLLSSNTLAIMNKLISNPEYIKDIGNFYFPIYYHFFNKVLEDGNCSIKKIEIFPNFGEELFTKGYFDNEIKVVNINTRYLCEYKNNDFITSLNHLYHEVVHAKQFEYRDKNEFDYEALLFLKDSELSDSIKEYALTGKNGNYNLSSEEVDARALAALKTFRLLEKSNPTQAEKYYNEIKDKYQKDCGLYYSLVRKDKWHKKNIHDLFEEKISKERIIELTKESPVLRLEYDEFGNRLSIDEIRSRLNSDYEALLDNPDQVTTSIAGKTCQFYYEYLCDQEILSPEEAAKYDLLKLESKYEFDIKPSMLVKR